MDKLKQLIAYYMKQYGYSQKEAIRSIRADLKEVEQGGSVVLSGYYGT